MKKLLIRCIECYQRNVSPTKPRCCRFMPTCSAYAKEAIEVHGVAKGGLLAIWRLLRCHPLCKGGYDPVPPKKQSANRK